MDHHSERYVVKIADAQNGADYWMVFISQDFLVELHVPIVSDAIYILISVTMF